MKDKKVLEFNLAIIKAIEVELANTPEDMKLNVEMIMEKEGLRLNFTRTKGEIKMNNEGIGDKLIKAVKEEREKTRKVREKIIADWEEAFDTAFLGNLWNNEDIEVLVKALVEREEE